MLIRTVCEVVECKLVLLKDNQVLLSLRQNTGFADGMFSLVGGHMDGRESATQAMIREAREEAGIEIAPQDLSLRSMMHIGFKEGEEYIHLYFICYKWKGKLQNKEPHKCAELKFYSLLDLPSNLLPLARAGIECALNGILYCEYGALPQEVDILIGNDTVAL